MVGNFEWKDQQVVVREGYSRSHFHAGVLMFFPEVPVLSDLCGYNILAQKICTKSSK